METNVIKNEVSFHELFSDYKTVGLCIMVSSVLLYIILGIGYGCNPMLLSTMAVGGLVLSIVGFVGCSTGY